MEVGDAEAERFVCRVFGLTMDSSSSIKLLIVAPFVALAMSEGHSACVYDASDKVFVCTGVTQGLYLVNPALSGSKVIVRPGAALDSTGTPFSGLSSGVPITLENSGRIEGGVEVQGGGQTGGVILAGTLSAIVNNPGGVIIGHDRSGGLFGGVSVGGNGFSVINHGTIQGWTGVHMSPGASLLNYGTIVGDGVGVAVRESNVNGGAVRIVNEGLIRGGTALLLGHWGDPSIENHGTLLATSGPTITTTCPTRGGLFGRVYYDCVNDRLSIKNTGTLVGPAVSGDVFTAIDARWASSGETGLRLELGTGTRFETFAAGADSTVTRPGIARMLLPSRPSEIVLTGHGAAAIETRVPTLGTPVTLRRTGASSPTETWVLSGTNPSFNAMFVESGTLVLHGEFGASYNGVAFAATTVSHGATLGGTALIWGTVSNFGNVSPGTSIGTGTLTIQGDYTQYPGSALRVKVDGAASDRLLVTGPARLAGTLEIRALGAGPVGGQIYTVVEANPASGTFDAVTDDLTFFDFQAKYGIDGVQLAATAVSFTEGALRSGSRSANNLVLAGGFDRVVAPGTGALASGNADFNAVLSTVRTLAPAQVGPAFNTMTGETYAAVRSIVLAQTELLRDVLLAAASRRSLLGVAPLRVSPSMVTADAGTQVGAGGPPVALPMSEVRGNPDQENQTWVNGYYPKGRVNGSDGRSGYDYSLASVLGGVDRVLTSETSVGLAIGYAQPILDDYQFAASRFDGQSLLAGVYGRHLSGGWELAGMLGYTYSRLDGSRQISMPGLERTATASFDTYAVNAAFRTGYALTQGRWVFEPHLLVGAAYLRTNGFRENGANSLNFELNGDTTRSLVTGLGVRAGTSIDFGSGWIRPEVSFRYQHDFLARKENAVTARFRNVPETGSLTFVGQSFGPDALTVAVGMSADVARSAALNIGAFLEFRENAKEYGLGASLTRAW